MESKCILNNQLARASSHGYRVDIFIGNGLCITGEVLEFDPESILVKSSKTQQEQVIMRHAILTVQRCTSLGTSSKQQLSRRP